VRDKRAMSRFRIDEDLRRNSRSLHSASVPPGMGGSGRDDNP